MPMAESIAECIAHNVRRLRDERGISQQKASQLARVPRPTWANLESGQANPTIAVLTKVAHALNVRVEDLLSPAKTTVRFYPAESLPKRRRGKASVRSLIAEPVGGLEIERMVLPPQSQIVATPHPPSTFEYLTCEVGELELQTDGERHHLRAGDVIVFRADQSHSYHNPGPSRSIAYCVVTLSFHGG